MEYILIAFLVVLSLLILVSYKYFSLYAKIERRAREIFEKWREESLEREISLRLKEEEKRIREDAIAKSSSVIMGKVGEQLTPVLLFEKEGINPKDMRFIGTPIDYIVFKGLSDGKIEEIIFLEVKTGRSKLSGREKEVKRAVLNGKVSWRELYLRPLLRYQ